MFADKPVTRIKAEVGWKQQPVFWKLMALHMGCLIGMHDCRVDVQMNRAFDAYEWSKIIRVFLSLIPAPTQCKSSQLHPPTANEHCA